MRRRVVQRGVAVAAGLVLTGALGGCGAGSYGFAPATDNGGTTLGNLLAFNSPNAPSPTKPLDTEEKPTCPPIEVLDGTASSRVYGSGDQTNSNVRYQFSMGDVVRECSHAGGQLLVKVGVEGRALLGPAGSPGGFTAPVRIAVRGEKDGKVITSKLYQIPVSIGAGDNAAPFSIVTDPVPVPYLSAHADEDYTILVGFDPKGDGAMEAKPRAKKHHRG